MYDPVSDSNSDISKLQKKLETATGGMKAVIENKIRDEQRREQTVNENTEMMDKIRADNERLKAAALATWNRESKDKSDK